MQFLIKISEEDISWQLGRIVSCEMNKISRNPFLEQRYMQFLIKIKEEDDLEGDLSCENEHNFSKSTFRAMLCNS